MALVPQFVPQYSGLNPQFVPQYVDEVLRVFTVRYTPPQVPFTTETGAWCTQPNGLPDTVILETDIVEGSFGISAASNLDSPTVVTVNYLPPTGNASAWVSQPARQSVVGVDTGEVDEINSDIDLPGVQRLVEALRKARSRLTRLQFPGRYTWETFDNGVKFTKGDVVILPDIRGLSRQFVRIIGIDMGDAGKYQITAEHYDPSMYADQIVPEGENGIVPIGLILPYEGSLPDGWADYSAANGKYIIGAGGSTAIGEVAGSSVVTTTSGVTQVGGSHVAAPVDFNYETNTGSGTTSDVGNVVESPTLVNASAHQHNFTVASYDPNLYRRHTKLMKKTGSTSLVLPAESLIFGRDEIYYFGIQRVIEHNARFMVADSATMNAGVFSLGISGSVNTNSTTSVHTHTPGTSQQATYSGTEGSFNYEEIPNPPHAHTFTASVIERLRKRYLAVYGSDSQYVLRPGMIGMWDGDMESLPADFYLCDGTNGTIDLVDYFIVYAGITTAAPVSTESAIQLLGETNEVGHNHRGPYLGRGSGTPTDVNRAHFEDVSHKHGINTIKPWNPPGYALAFIQYLP